MIATVTLNAAIDKTLVCQELEINGITRAEEAYIVAGGKGINVARSFSRLGGKALATGFIGGANGVIIRDLLEAERLPNRFFEIRDSSRMCLAVIQKGNQTITEIYDPSPVVREEEWESFKSFISALAKKVEMISFNGSLPAGLSPDAYNDLIHLVREVNKDCLVILDTSGEALKKGIEAKPFMIKPNRSEMETLLGRPLSDEEGQVKAVRTLLEEGIDLVVLSLGDKGVVFGHSQAVYKIEPLSVEVKSTVGSGDSLVGGFARKFLTSGDIIEAVKYGAASATSNLTSKTQGDVSPAQVEEFFTQLNVYQVS